MGNSNTFACMIMVAVMYTMWLLLYQKNKWYVKIVLIGAIVLDYYALMFSAGRKFFVMPFVFLYVLLLFRVDGKGKKHIFKYTIIISILLLIVSHLIMTVPVFYETIGYRMESYINGIRGIEEQGSSAAMREEMQKMAITKWIDRPFFGYGFDSFKNYNVTVTGHRFYSHCNYTELLYNGGIFYFLVYYWIYWSLCKKALINKCGQLKYRAFAVGILICFLIFDYGCVSYSMAFVQIMLALSFRVLDFKERSLELEKE